MSLLKCKMCGGDLEISSDSTIATCEYCGTKQVVPKISDENLQNLFNRANTLRIKCEFDKAEKLYEKIIQMDTTQADAYWGLILCKYGIEYVDDPATLKKIPTCHRTSYDSIIADEDYKSALANADFAQKALYEEQAKEIDRIQKEILALAQKEETYDVFICYKETDFNGQRTPDSVVANDIYYQLTNEGFKVFYAAITLEGKLGKAYEPIIFAALNSAKVMLAIGTKPEHFNAVWVKNEWSRYLKIIKNDRSKLLIPCYRDMDAYELPDEFAHLQAQDMSKIGFITDLVRGIKKVINKEDTKIVSQSVSFTASNTNNEILLDRAFILLEDGDAEKADAICEQVLNQEPKNPRAYLLKLMMELNVKREENLKYIEKPFDKNPKYQRIMQYGDSALKSKLTSYISYINQKIADQKLEQENAKKAAKEQSNFAKLDSEDQGDFEKTEVDETLNFETLPKDDTESHKRKSIILGLIISVLFIFVVAIIIWFIVFMGNANNNDDTVVTDDFVSDDDLFQSELSNDIQAADTENSAITTEKPITSTETSNTSTTMTATNDTVYVLYTANIRESAKATAKVLCEVPFASVLSRTEKNSKWSKVTYEDGNGGSYTGYIMNDLITTNVDTVTFEDQGVAGEGENAAKVYPTSKLIGTGTYRLRYYPLSDNYPNKLVLLSSDDLGEIGSIRGGTEVTILEVSKDKMWAKISCTKVDIAMNGKYEGNYTSTETGYIPYSFLEISGNTDSIG